MKLFLVASIASLVVCSQIQTDQRARPIASAALVSLVQDDVAESALRRCCDGVPVVHLTAAVEDLRCDLLESRRRPARSARGLSDASVSTIKTDAGQA